jgi:RNA polymerase sigma-70 factor (ECF subfamily)
MTRQPARSLSTLSDAELAHLAGKREDASSARTAEAAFDELHARYTPKLVAWLAAWHDPRIPIEDVVQQAWLNVWRAIPMFQGTQFSGWIFEIARNTLYEDHRRKRATTLGDEDESLADRRGDDPSRALIDAEDSALFARCLGTLEPYERNVMQAKLAGEDYDVITKRFGISKDRAYKLFFNGMTKLKTCVGRAQR